MPTPWTSLIEQIHVSEHKLVLAVTGGGSKAISQLLDFAGASQTVLEAVVPYSYASLEAWLGGPPEKSCCEPTSRAMAMASWTRARQLAPDVAPQLLVGIGATASLATLRPKRGEHRIHVAAQTATHTASCTLYLSKGSRDRKKEQWIAAKLILLVIGEACQVDTSATCRALNDQLFKNEPLTSLSQEADPSWTEVLLGNQNCLALPSQSSELLSPTNPPTIVFPGAFNPPHLGHRRMAEIAANRLGYPVAFELSITNVDKPPIDYLALQKRIEVFQQWDPSAQLLLTDAPTFETKSALFPHSTFVVGADTIKRIADLRYYNNQPSIRDAAIQSLADRECRFLVFGRYDEENFQGLSDLNLPPSLLALCEEVPKNEFCEKVSSTALRQRN